MRQVCVVLPVRLGSSRFPNKALSELGGQSLIARACKQLGRVSLKANVPAYLAAWSGDVPLIEEARRWGIDVIPLTERAVKAQTWAEYTAPIYDYLVPLDSNGWVAIPNLVCMPFARDETIVEGVERCRVATQPFDCCVAERNKLWTFDDRGEVRPMMGIKQYVDTKNNPWLIRSCHLMTGCAVSDLAIEARITSTVPWMPKMSKAELVDIDTPEDLEFARVVERGQP